MTQTFTVTLTDDQAADLSELARHWNHSLEEMLRRIAVDGIDMEMQIKAHDEREAAGEPERENPNRDKPGGDLDDGIPF
jgi:hypothetical protein